MITIVDIQTVAGFGLQVRVRGGPTTTTIRYLTPKYDDTIKPKIIYLKIN